MHLHGPSPVGTVGPVFQTLPLGSFKDFAFPLTPALRSALLAGLVYVNLHSVQHPLAEIRGQVLGRFGMGLVFRSLAPLPSQADGSLLHDAQSPACLCLCLLEVR